MRVLIFFVILMALVMTLSGFAAGEVFEWTRSANKVILTVEADAYVYANSVRITARGQAVDAPNPPAKFYLDPFAEETLEIYGEGVHQWVLPSKLASEALSIDYQGCSGKLCLPPKSIVLGFDKVNIATLDTAQGSKVTSNYRRFDGVGTIGELKTFLQLDSSSAKEDTIDAKGSVGSLLALGKSAPVWLALLGVLFGGFLLNLTPCVLPLIPLNLAFIGAGDKSNAMRGFARGALYGAGMMVAYGMLGVAVLAWGMNFGTLNSSWVFNYAISILFGALALAMFGVFNFDLSQFQGHLNIGSKWASGVGVTALGAVAALLAGTCVAPVVIGVLLWAATLQSQGVIWAWGLPFVLGLGMALPWPFAGAGIGVLPRAGSWTKFIKWGFGSLILIVALYYGYLGTKLILYKPSYQVSYEVIEKAMEQAKADQKVLLIDFWASWCKNCDALDYQMNTPEIQQELKRYLMLKIQAENMNDPATKELLARFGVIGLPALVAINP